ncbi:MAG: response regulator [Salinivirgaceae bacterium]|nr:response regulator [Salinivirgaceae bacterium]
MKRLIIVATFFLMPTMLVLAQTERFFTAGKELSSSLINNVYQDGDGVVWVATDDGLNRCDGAKFTIFRNEEGVSSSLKNNHTIFIYEDSCRNLFVGTMGGLQIYDRATGLFSGVPVKTDDEVLKQATVGASCIIEIKKGLLLVGSSGYGLFKLENEASGFAMRRVDVPGMYIESMLYSGGEDVWVGTSDAGFLRLDIDLNVKNQISLTSGEAVFCICQTANGELYAGTSKGNLLMYDKQNNKFVNMASVNQPGCGIRSLCVIGKDLAVGTDGCGMKSFDTEKHELTKSTISLTSIDDSKAKIRSMMTDMQGNLWVGCYQKGMALVSARKSQFKYIGGKSGTNNIIGSSCVTSLLQLHDGKVLAGTDGDGIYELELNEGTEPVANHMAAVGVVPNTITCMFEDSRHDIWLGSYMEGLAHYNSSAKEFQPFILKHGSPSVSDIVEDHHCNLYVAVPGVGIYQVDSARNTVKLFEYEQHPDNDTIVDAMCNARLTSLCLSGKNLYYGTNSGLGCLDIETESFVQAFGKNVMLRGQFINDLRTDINNNLWIGTSSGLVRMDCTTFETIVYDKSYGFYNSSVSAVETDADGNIWTSTNRGLSCFNIQNNTFVHYNSNDGLQCDEFSRNASVSCADSTIIFGGTGGIVQFNPLKIIPDNAKPVVRIADIYLNGRALRKGMLSGDNEVMSTSVNEAEEINLSYKDNSFVVEFTSFSYLNPDRIVYSYKLDENDWTTLNRGEKKVNFSELPIGKHSLLVKAHNNNLESDVRRLTVDILPQWYQTNIAFACFLLITLGILLLLALYEHNRHSTKLQFSKMRMQDEANEAKLQFFFNMSHEIRTPISLIVGPLQKLIQEESDSTKLHTYKIMKRNTDRIMNLVNQLLDSRKIDKGQMKMQFEQNEIVGMVRNVCTLFDNQAETKGVKYQVETKSPEIHAWVDAGKFDKIIVNLLSNAFKFTPDNGTITVEISEGEDEKAVQPELQRYFEVSVVNSGEAISPDDMAHIFERYYQSQNTNISNVFGTGLGLHLTRSLVQLHHGTIDVENVQDGVRFTVRMPRGSEHLSSNDIVFDENWNTPPAQETEILIPDIVDDSEDIRSKTSRRVLVVEDDEDGGTYIKNELSKYFHTTLCANGREAYELILKNAPDAIVCDIMMPEMDGITLCKKIRSHIKYNMMPIVLLSALDGAENRIKGWDAGADAYFSKPFNIDELIHTLQNIMRTRVIIKNNLSGNQEQKQNVKEIEMESPDEKLMQRIMKVINENMDNPDLNAEFIADKVGISRVHLYRKLKMITNQPTRDFIRNQRLAQAAQMLEKKRYNITELSEILGFNTPAYFSSAFKKLYGMTPTEYMESNMRKMESGGESEG